MNYDYDDYNAQEWGYDYTSKVPEYLMPNCGNKYQYIPVPPRSYNPLAQADFQARMMKREPELTGSVEKFVPARIQPQQTHPNQIEHFHVGRSPSGKSFIIQIPEDVIYMFLMFIILIILIQWTTKEKMCVMMVKPEQTTTK